MRTIYRYELPITDYPVLDMPAGAQVLPAPPGVRNRGELVEIWAQVDTSAPVEPRRFRVVGTGNPMPDDCGRFIGSVTTHGGMGVWHIFEAAE